MFERICEKLPVSRRRFLKDTESLKQEIISTQDMLHKVSDQLDRITENEKCLAEKMAEDRRYFQETVVNSTEPLAIAIEKGLTNLEKQDRTLIHRRGDRLEMALARLTAKSEISFDVALAEHCNLNCYGCNHFSNITEEKYADYDELDRDFARIAELFGNRVRDVHLLGGEPLLNTHIADFIYLTRARFPEATVDLLTNAILLPQMEKKFWTACRECNVKVRITKYPIKIDFDKIEHIACAEKVKLEYFDHTGEVVKTSDKYTLDITGSQNGNRAFMLCFMANRCTYYTHGRLYPCPVAGNIFAFNKKFNTNLVESTGDYIDIYKAKSSEEIMAFLSKPIPFCRYCDIDGRCHNIEWHVSSKTIDEWT